MSVDLQSLEVAIFELLEQAGVELFDLELRQGKLCVTVTRPGGLDLEALTAASRTVSDFLDAHVELTPDEPFELEVSSPGLERRLRRPQHFHQAVGQTIAVRTTGNVDGARRDEGQLLSADDDKITIMSLATNAKRELAYDEIDRAHTVFDWKAALASDKRSRDDSRTQGDAPPHDEVPDDVHDQARAPHMENKR